MDLRVLNYFLMIAREENITRAAALLHVTQPTLSRQMIQLEEELGVTLFYRSRHKIVLTDDGMLLKRRAEEILGLAEKTKRDFLRREEEIEGELTIGSGELKNSQTLSQMLYEFRKKYPRVTYELYSGNSDNIKEQIERGLLDVGLLLEPVDISKYDFVRMPLKEEWGALVREDSDLARKESVGPKDLAGRPLLLSKRKTQQNELRHWFGEYAEQIQTVAVGNLWYNMAVLVKNGLGTAVTIQVDTPMDGLVFLPLDPPLAFRTVLVWKKVQAFSPVTKAFLDFAKEYVLRMDMDS